MSYQVLARKWRPRSFKDMIGQEAIIRMLSNALEQQRLHHAYLFTGTRGVGKTTIARILAKCLNCEAGINANACGKCANCIAIDNGQFLDLYEVDAASRTKVEDTRELLENVPYPPSQGRYKIYLIDEVHMLSNHSFNALLKTLEEPPAHVKFLLATTDPKKLPITILSRCLQFYLKRITPEQIAQQLQHICEIENVTFDADALSKLATAADGSMRDALSLLDQAIAYGVGSVNIKDVNAMLGSLAQDELIPLLQALAAADGKTLFAHIRALAEHSPDFEQVLADMVSILHRIAITQIVPDALSVDKTIQDLAQQFTPENVQLYYQIALLGRRDLAFMPSPQQGFEMTMLRMLAFNPVISSAIKTTDPITQPPPTPVSIAPVEKKIAANLEVQTSELSWRDLISKLDLSGMAQALAANCTMISMNDTKVELALAASHQPMLNKKLQDRIAESLSQYFKRSIKLDIKISTEELMTPLKEQQQEKSSRLAEATQKIMQNPHIQKLIETYDATVEVSLV